MPMARIHCPDKSNCLQGDFNWFGANAPSGAAANAQLDCWFSQSHVLFRSLVASCCEGLGPVWIRLRHHSHPFSPLQCATGQLMNAANDSALEAVPGFAWPNPAACLTGCQDMSRYSKVWSEKQWVIKSSLSGQILVERRKLYETIRFFLSPGFLGFLGLQSCLRGRLFWRHWGPKRVLHIQYRWGHWMPLDALIICFCCEDTWSLDQQWQAEAVASVLENIINAGYPPDQIVVLTAYLAQKQAQKVPNMFSSPIRCFQGTSCIMYIYIITKCSREYWLQSMTHVQTRNLHPAPLLSCNYHNYHNYLTVGWTWPGPPIWLVPLIVTGAPTGYPWSWLRALFDLLSCGHHWWLPGAEGCDLWVYCIRRYAHKK